MNVKFCRNRETLHFYDQCLARWFVLYLFVSLINGMLQTNIVSQIQYYVKLRNSVQNCYFYDQCFARWFALYMSVSLISEMQQTNNVSHLLVGHRWQRCAQLIPYHIHHHHHHCQTNISSHHHHLYHHPNIPHTINNTDIIYTSQCNNG